MPSKHVCTVKEEEAFLLHAILKGCKINLGKVIEKSILNYQSSNFRGHMPHPAIITYLCIKGGVTFNRNEEEECPKTSPLTLTAFTKPPFNKSKKKLIETEVEGRDRATELDSHEPNN